MRSTHSTHYACLTLVRMCLCCACAVPCLCQFGFAAGYTPTATVHPWHPARYYDRHVLRHRTEELKYNPKSPLGTTRSSTTVHGADRSAVFVAVNREIGGGTYAMASVNLVFRVGRVCGKLCKSCHPIATPSIWRRRWWPRSMLLPRYGHLAEPATQHANSASNSLFPALKTRRCLVVCIRRQICQGSSRSRPMRPSTCPPRRRLASAASLEYARRLVLTPQSRPQPRAGPNSKEVG